MGPANVSCTSESRTPLTSDTSQETLLVSALTVAHRKFCQSWSNAQSDKALGEGGQVLVKTSEHICGILHDLGDNTSITLSSDLRNLECDMENLGTYSLGEMVENEEAFWKKGNELYQRLLDLVDFVKHR